MSKTRPDPRKLVHALLDWFPVNSRDLPWRRTQDPYAIWVSEIMLQQTQVQTVIPYWERWMRALPNLQSLARSRPERVLKLWEGLGYYSRVRNLQRAAQVILEEHGGIFPRSYAAVLELPGIGRYTAGAICSIAFNEPTAILDGNVVRVLSRVWGVKGNVKSKPVQARLWHLAERLVRTAFELSSPDARACSILNQSVMELGAILCTPRNPDCPSCPVRSWCVARRTGQTNVLPTVAKRPVTTRRQFDAFVLWSEGRVLIRQRANGVVNGGLWEFPNVERNGATTSLEELAGRCAGTPLPALAPLCRIEHSITRFRIEMHVHEATLPSAPVLKSSGRWCTLAEVEQQPLPSAHRKILRLLQQRPAERPQKSRVGRAVNDGSCSRGRTTRSRSRREPGPAQTSS